MTDPREIAPPVAPAKTMLTSSAAMLRAQERHDGGEVPPPKGQRNKAWRPADMARLANLIAAGYSWPEIGNIMGRTGDACRMQARRLTAASVRPRLSARLLAAWVAFWRR